MRNILLFLFALVLTTCWSSTDARAGYYCQMCQEADWEDENFSCDECGLCEGCAIENHWHCEDCGACNESTPVCEECGQCYETCGVSNGQHCSNCYICYSFMMVCENCGFCEDCIANETFTHCFQCLDCLGELQNECCGACDNCVQDANRHCIGCDACASGDDAEICENCYYCTDCANNEPTHCQFCHSCYPQDICPECLACPDCMIEGNLHCQNCWECWPDEVCNDCWRCINCAIEDGYHCSNCESHIETCPDCHLCGDCMLEEGMHCPACMECFMGDVCPECYFCYGCAVDAKWHCENCVENHVTESCSCEGLCDDCIADRGLHCPGCDACGSEEELCDICRYCSSCAESEGIHCSDCGECFEDEGGTCDQCGLCPECAIANGEHCTECGQHANVCDNCSLCDDCADDEGFHCHECGECKMDEMCESGGEHCADCCESNGWLCPECGECAMAKGNELCENCSLCNDCCVGKAEDLGCSHSICVESDVWADHFCSICNLCKTDCEHAEPIAEHVCKFVGGYCTICKASERGLPSIYRQPKSSKCLVLTPDASAAEMKANTTTLSVGANGDDLAFQWYSCDANGKNRVALADANTSKSLVTGAKTSKLTITVPEDACHVQHFYLCEVRGSKGNVSSDVVALNVSHNYAWQDLCIDKSGEYSYVLSSGATVKMALCNYHYKACMAEGCDAPYIARARHNYSDWVVDEAPTEQKMGLQYKECADCGARFYQQMDKLPVEGAPQIVVQPRNQTLTAFDATLDGTETLKDYLASFSVECVARDKQGNDYTCTYQWYRCSEDGTNIERVVDNAVTGQSGATSSTLKVNATKGACALSAPLFYRCEISNAKGVAKSNVVSLSVSHNEKWAPKGTYGNAPGDHSLVVSRASETSSASVTMRWNDKHYLKCVGCNAELGATSRSQAHTFGKWTVAARPTESLAGSMYRECSVCGEREWQNLTVGQMAPIITLQPVDVTCHSTDYDLRNTTADASNTISFTVDAMSPTKSSIYYQWYRKRLNGTGVTKLVDKTNPDDAFENVSGATSKKLTVVVPMGACDYYDKGNPYVYYCVLSSKQGTTTSGNAIVKAKHNMQWQMFDRLDDKYNDGDVVSRKITIYNDANYHYYACTDPECEKVKTMARHDDNVDFHYDPVPTTASSGKKFFLCNSCGYQYSTTVAKLSSAEGNLYTASGDVMQITDVTKMDWGTVYSVSVLSGKPVIDRNLNFYVVHPDGKTQVVNINELYSANGTTYSGYNTEGMSFSAKDKDVKVTFTSYQYGPKNDYDVNDLPVGSIISNSPDVARFSKTFEGYVRYSEALSVGQTIYLKFNDKWSLATVTEVLPSTNKAVDFTEEAYVSTHVKLSVPADVVVYEGMKVAVGILNSSTHKIGTSTKYSFSLTDTHYDEPDVWVITAAGDTVSMKVGDNRYIDAGQTIGFDYQNGIIVLRNAKLRAIYIGDELINGKTPTISVRGECSVSNPTKAIKARGKDGIYAAGDLVVYSQTANANVSVSSASGCGVKVDKKLTFRNRTSSELFWKLDLLGYSHALSAESVDYDAPVAIHFKTLAANMALAPLVDGRNFCDKSVFGIFYSDDPRSVLSFTDERFEDDGDVFWCVYNGLTDTYAKDFYVSPAPNIAFANGLYKPTCSYDYFNMTVVDYGGKYVNPYNKSKECKMTYDLLTNVLTLENVSITNYNLPDYVKSDLPLSIGATPGVDTVYVKLVGKNSISDLNFKSSTSQAGAFFVGTNVKFIGDGSLYISSVKNTGVTLALDASIFVDGKTSISLNRPIVDVATSDAERAESTSSLHVGPQASLQCMTGYEGETLSVANLIIDDPRATVLADGTLDHPTRIVSPACVTFLYKDRQYYVDGKVVTPAYGLNVSNNSNVRIGKQWYDFDVYTVDEESQAEVFLPAEEGNGCVIEPCTIKAVDNKWSALYIGAKDWFVNIMTWKEGQALTLVGNEGAPAICIAPGSNATISPVQEEGVFDVASLFVQSLAAGYGIEVGEGATLTLKDLELVKFGSGAHVYGTGTVIVENSTVEFEENVTISGVNLVLRKASFENENHKYDKTGELSGARQVLDLSGSEPVAVDGNFRIVRSNHYDVFDKPAKPIKPDVPVADPDEPDAIPVITADRLDKDAPVFTLRGERVYGKYRGIVVQNGRKYLVK